MELSVADAKLMLEEAKLQQAAESSFYEFVKQAWPSMHGGKQFVDGKHIEVICAHLEMLAARKIKKLLINIPPRFGKSSIISVAFPAWVWIKNAGEQFLCASYVAQFSNRDSRKCRALIQSPWYQKYWGQNFSLLPDQNTKTRFDNTKKGYRIATSSKGSTTAEGGSIIICDDPNSAADGTSKAERDARIEWWSQTMSSRFNDMKNDCIIVVQQRIHEKDVSGYIIANDSDNEWVKLILPMEFEIARKSSTFINGQKWWHDWRKEEGELLWSDYIGEKEIKTLKQTLGSYGYAGQFQQRPAPVEGGIIKKDWFKLWVRPSRPAIKFILQSWDTAISDKPDAAYSACTTWGIFVDDNKVKNIMLLSAWRGRVGYPDLRKRAERLYNNYEDIYEAKDARYKTVHKVIVEAKATGDPLIRDLRLASIPAIGYTPKGDKESRVQRISHLIECGRVWLPTKRDNPEKLVSWADEFREEVCNFPNRESRDFVDTLSQALQYMIDSKLIFPSSSANERQDQSSK